jgi:hypothetical protein
MKTLSKQDIINIEKALTHHIDYKIDFDGIPVSLKGVPMLPYSPNSSCNYLRVMDYISMNNKGSFSEKLSATLEAYYRIVGVSNLKEALQRLKSLEV